MTQYSLGWGGLKFRARFRLCIDILPFRWSLSYHSFLLSLEMTRQAAAIATGLERACLLVVSFWGWFSINFIFKIARNLGSIFFLENNSFELRHL